ncbi:winged helix DNA-binding protein, partial [Acinetobacter baumannii]
DLFFDPCWDILLDLYIAHRKNRQISISSACMAANVPTSTALRWITTLERRGLVLSEKDAKDSRRRLVRLTLTAIAQVS